MPKQRSYDDELYAQFVTFSCYRRRKLLDHDRVKKSVLGVLDSQLIRQSARCVGFVIMPDHAYAVIWLPEPGQLSRFMKHWKQRSSFSIKKLLAATAPHYSRASSDDASRSNDPVWQRKYDAFQIESERKLEEKLTDVHLNPVRAGVVEKTIDWPWSPVGWYDSRCSVGVPIRWVG